MWALFNIEGSQNLIFRIGEADLIDVLISSFQIEVFNLFKSLLEMIGFLETPGNDSHRHRWRQK